MADVPIAIPVGTVHIKGPARPVIVLALVVGAFAYTGLAPTVLNAASPVLTPGAGQVVWQGLTPTVRVGDVVSDIPAGAIVFKGPQRSAPRADVGVGALAFTGRTLSLAVDVPGSVATIPTGSLVLTGLAPERLNTLTVAIPVGSLPITGQYVRVAFKGLDAGRLVWQGLAPTVSGTTAGEIAIPKGTLTITGLACHVGRGIDIPAGSLVLDTPDMSVTTTGNIEIPAGQLVYQGYVVTEPPFFLAVPAGSVVFSGQTPVPDATGFLGAGNITYTGRTPIPLVALVAITNPEVDRALVSITRTAQASVGIRRRDRSTVTR